MARNFRSVLRMVWDFSEELFCCVYCFLSQDGSMSKTLRRYSRESFLIYFKDLYRVRFGVLQRETSAIILHPKD